MLLDDLEPGASYSFERNGNTYTGTYQEWFGPDMKTRRVKLSRKSKQEMVCIVVENPKGGAPLGYSVALEDLTNG